MGAHGRLARLCAVGGAAASFALVKVDYQPKTLVVKLKTAMQFNTAIWRVNSRMAIVGCQIVNFRPSVNLILFDNREWKLGKREDGS